MFCRFTLNKLTIRNMSSFYYAVAVGREIGIYDNWTKCEEQIKGYRGARYKKFPTKSAAEAFIYEHNKFKTNKKITYNCKEYTPTTDEPPANLQLDNKSKIEVDDFWPPSDGDTFDESQLTDNDLLMALAEVEGLPLDVPTKSLKRKTNFNLGDEHNTSSKIFKSQSKESECSGLKHIGNFEFQIDSEGYVIVYTDGSCFNNGQANACAGFGVWFGDEHPLNIGKPVEGRVTNNVGEIQAAIYAVKTAKLLAIRKLCIYTDSKFLINSVTLWIKGWKTKNWRLKNGEPVKNVVDFKELDSLLIDRDVDIKWNYVAAHKGIKGNEMADRLAREGSETYKRLHMKK